MRSAFSGRPRPLVFGHRGAGGEAPENTMVSFERAMACGVDVLELDVHATRDGVIVVIHDPTLERTTNGVGGVAEQTWSELQRVDAGHQFSIDGRDYPFRGRGVRIPSLLELIERFPAARFNIEVKQAEPPIAAAVVDLLVERGCTDRALLAAEHDHIMAAIRKVAGDRVPTSFATGEVVDFIGRVQSDDWEGYRAPGCALQIPPGFQGIDLVTPASLGAAHSRGLEIHAWTINHRDEMDRLLALGVDGLMSDLPALARTAVDEWRRR